MSSTSSSTAAAFTVAQFPSLSDNYGFLVHDPSTGATAAIDTPSSLDYRRELTKRDWTLTHIFNTHHHHDHVGGNLKLKNDETGGGEGGATTSTAVVTVTGPASEAANIPGIDRGVYAGDTIQFGNIHGQVLDVGGHTKGHIAYFFPDQKTLFCGDALFALGCGRMFEGTPTQFWSSLERLRALPDETTVYCAHEYTQANAKFALSVEPTNEHLVARVAVVDQKRKRGEPTVPFLLGEEKKSNPFLRVDVSDEIRRNIGVSPDDTPAEAFGKLRKAKDRF